jgi:hypothetical protein
MLSKASRSYYWVFMIDHRAVFNMLVAAAMKNAH